MPLTATTVEEGKTKLQDQYDLILLDINLPDGNGMEVASAAKQQGSQAPIIAVTAHSTEEEIELLGNVGIIDFIEKPITKEKLTNILLCHLFAKE